MVNDDSQYTLHWISNKTMKLLLLISRQAHITPAQIVSEYLLQYLKIHKTEIIKIISDELEANLKKIEQDRLRFNDAKTKKVGINTDQASSSEEENLSKNLPDKKEASISYEQLDKAVEHTFIEETQLKKAYSEYLNILNKL